MGTKQAKQKKYDTILAVLEKYGKEKRKTINRAH
jgi:hypothetical protein